MSELVNVLISLKNWYFNILVYNYLLNKWRLTLLLNLIMYDEEHVNNNFKNQNNFRLKNIENINYQTYEKEKYCYMITRNKCSHQFSYNERIIQCRNCKSNFCIDCFEKGYTHVKTIATTYFKCPSCDMINTQIILTNHQSCIIS